MWRHIALTPPTPNTSGAAFYDSPIAYVDTSKLPACEPIDWTVRIQFLQPAGEGFTFTMSTGTAPGESGGGLGYKGGSRRRFG